MTKNKILIVCTGNICRSPMAEAFLRVKLNDAGLDFDISSAGILNQDRKPPQKAIEVMRTFGLDISDHSSRLLETIDIEEFDLIFGMAKEHVRDIAVLAKNKLKHTFTIKEFVQRASNVGPKRITESMDDWLSLVVQGRRSEELLGADLEMDVVDPFDKGGDAFRDVAAELDKITSQVVYYLNDSMGVD